MFGVYTIISGAKTLCSVDISLCFDRKIIMYSRQVVTLFHFQFLLNLFYHIFPKVYKLPQTVLYNSDTHIFTDISEFYVKHLPIIFQSFNFICVVSQMPKSDSVRPLSKMAIFFQNNNNNNNHHHYCCCLKSLFLSSTGWIKC